MGWRVCDVLADELVCVFVELCYLGRQQCGSMAEAYASIGCRLGSYGVALKRVLFFPPFVVVTLLWDCLPRSAVTFYPSHTPSPPKMCYANLCSQTAVRGVIQTKRSIIGLAAAHVETICCHYGCQISPSQSFKYVENGGHFS